MSSSYTPVPPVPDLEPSDPSSSTPALPSNEPTNTYALLLPHPGLFSPDILDHLHTFYCKFGEILHWAPVKGLGRVIVVWRDETMGKRARCNGGGFLEIGGETTEERLDQVEKDTNGHGRTASQANCFAEKRKRPKSLIIRLFPLPPTPQSTLDALSHPISSHSPSHPSPHHLAPPEHPRNFLVSPPGSPPEGWEPILEDAPNDRTLAEDLIKALEGIEIDLGGKSMGKRRWVGESGEGGDGDEDMDGEEESGASLGNVVLETDSGTVFAVQAPVEESQPNADTSNTPPLAEQVEYVSHTNSHSHSRSIGSMFSDQNVPATAGWRTPGLGERTFSGRPMPTARPPLPE